MKKHTKEYAEELALAEVNGEIRDHLDLGVKRGFARGYLAAIEENAVPELITALSNLTEYVIRELNVVHELPQNQIDYITREAKSILNKINQ